MPLPIAPTGVELTVKKVLADEKNKRHLHDGRLALDKGLAMKILV